MFSIIFLRRFAPLWILCSWIATCVLFVPAVMRLNEQFGEQSANNDKHDEGYESPKQRLQHEFQMLANPRTGKIPDDIRHKELLFASTLPTAEMLAPLRAKRNSAQSNGSQAEIQATAWTSRGPFNVGGRTRALALDVSNTNTILAAGISGGIWRSTDAGASWQRVSPIQDVPNVSCIVQDTRPGKTNMWYAGTGEGWGNSASTSIGGAPYRGDGVYKSLDSGRTWRLLPSTSTRRPQRYDQRFDYVWSLAFDASNREQDELYAALFGCIKRSTDGGVSWQTVLGTDSLTVNGRFTDVAITPRGVVYATISRAPDEQGLNENDDRIQRGIFRSVDGVNWVNITPSDFPFNFRRIVIGIAPSNEDVVYFLAETPAVGFAGKNDDDTEWHSLFKYTNRPGTGTSTGAGGTWENRTANLPAFTGNGTQGDYVSQGSYDIVIAVKPDDENTVFIGGTNLYRSTDGFASTRLTSWIGGYREASSFAFYENHHADQHAIVFSPANPNIMYVGNDGGVSRTDNPLGSQVRWTALENGYVTTQFYAMAIAPESLVPSSPSSPLRNLIIGGMQDNAVYFTTSDNPRTAWQQAGSGDGTYCAVGTFSGNPAYYCGLQNGVLFRFGMSSDGRTIANSARIQPMDGENFAFVNPFVLDARTDNMLFMAAGRDVWRQENLSGIPSGSRSATSAGWTRFANLTRTSENVSALATGVTGGGISGTQTATRLYVGTSAGRVLRLDNANSTSQAQATDISTGKGFPPNGYIVCVAVDAQNADRVMAVLSNYEVQSLFYSENGGATWTAVGGNLEQFPDGTGNGPSCRWVSVLNDGNSLRYFVATSTGLYSTDNLQGAQTLWQQEGASVIGNVVVSMVQTRAADGLVVASTHGNGVFSANVSVRGASVLNNLAVQQNFPNPFSGTTTVGYRLPDDALVVVRIVDILGKHVRTLVNQTQSGGEYQTVWDGKDEAGISVAGGIYFYTIQVSREGSTVSRTGQMIKA